MALDDDRFDALDHAARRQISPGQSLNPARPNHHIDQMVNMTDKSTRRELETTMRICAQATFVLLASRSRGNSGDVS